MWGRTSLTDKDVFINSDVNEGGYLGFGDAGLLPSPYVPHLVGITEYRASGRVINHRGIDVPGYRRQKTLLVREDDDDAGKFGMTKTWNFFRRFA